MAIKSKATSIKVFSDVERTPVILSYELILPRTVCSKKISATARAFPYIKSSILLKDWVAINSTVNALRFVKNGSNIDVILCEGANLSPFYVAYYLSQKLKGDNIDCEFVNNSFIFRTDDETDTLAMGTALSNDGKAVLGLSSPTTDDGIDGANSYEGDISINGLYTGITNDTYWVKCSGNNLFTVTPDPSNIYQGTMEVAGTFNFSSSTTYTITIDTVNGNMTNQGKGFVPLFTVASTGDDDLPVACEIFSCNAWYEIGNKGVRVRFTDYPFGDNDSFQIDCLIPQTADGSNNTANADEATFIVTSNEGVMQSPTLLTFVDDPYTPYYKLVLAKGLEIYFEDEAFTKNDTFMVKAYMDTYYETINLNLGLVGIGEMSNVVGIRVIIKEGGNVLKWCKFSFLDKKELTEIGYGKTEFRAGTIGKINSKNSNEIVTTNNPTTVVTQFNNYLNYWELGYYYDAVGCGDPLFTSDPLFFIFKASEEETTQLITPSFKIYYFYK
jgi:hypothetical protein